jgi:hypothetical protein
MYPIFLALHNLVRWIVLILAVLFIVIAIPWSRPFLRGF